MTTTDAKTQHAIDFSFMTAAHAAFRRDLRWLTAAANAGTAGTPEVQAGWENFKTQLLIHHGVEDANLWPNLRRSAAHQPGELALLDEMEAEHAHLDPKLSAVDLALADQTPDLAEHVRNLAGALGEHLAHEERGVLPIIGVTDWKAFRAAMRRSLGVKGIAL